MKIPQIGALAHAHWLAKFSDVLTVYAAGFCTFFLYFRLPLWQGERYQWLVSLASLAAVFIFSIHGVYRSWRGMVRVGLVVRLFHGFLTLGAMIASYLYLTKTSHDISRLWFVAWLLFSFITSVLLRIIAYQILNWLRKHGSNNKAVALLGTTAACLEVMKNVQNDRFSGFQITHIRLLDMEDCPASLPPTVDCTVFDAHNLPPCPEIWICLPLSAGEAITKILLALRHSTANVRYLPDLQGVQLINHQISYVVGRYTLDISVSPIHGGQRALKWLFDKIIAFFALLLLLPLFVLVGGWIFVVAGWPIFYRQARVSWNGKIFYMLKFRTMPINSEKDGLIWGNAAAKKTILGGRILRRFSIDELPQFWNVLTGDMSIVGPRPERPQFVEQFKDEITGYMQKHMVKAGMTGWAQVNGWRGDTDLQERINHDLWYIENWSLWLDIKILLLTAARIFDDSAAC